MNIAPEQWQDKESKQCRICGDNCGEDICYSCEETAEGFGLELDDLMEMF